MFRFGDYKTEEYIPAEFKPSQNFLWSPSALSTLQDIMIVIDKTNLVSDLAVLVRKYINSDEDYIIWLEDPTQSIDDENVLVLAQTMEIYLKLTKKPLFSTHLIKYLGNILYKILDSTFHYNEWVPNNSEYYVINLLSETFNQNSVFTAYFLTRHVMYYDHTNILYHGYNLILQMEQVDLSILTNKQIRNVMDVLGTSRKFYVRFLLVMCYYLSREKTELNRKWFKSKFKVRNLDEFKLLLNDVLAEVVIITVSHNIKSENIN